MTATVLAISATTPMLCVTRISAMPRSFCRPRSRSRICAWIVTSRAVVGSSAIKRRGLQAAGTHAPRIRDKPHHRQHRHALAGSRLADDAEHLALVDREAHALDCVHDGTLRGKLYAEVFDFEEGHY